ncbi:IMP1 inner mitochondrial membrane peptidase-like [Podila clonocystis]|nr:IMP1 inner mitochondrial membrane peptidase-like [Podila clonocystis]
MSRYLKGAAIVIQVACGVQLFKENIAEFTWCFGPSMLPTLNMTGDIVGYESLTQRFSKLETGDLVVAVSPRDPSKLICKRIIGAAGDKVCIDPVSVHRQYITVPPGHYWLMGDNLNNSTDSREYGPVSGGLILGRVFARVWPSPKWIGNGMEEILEFS